MLDRRALAVDPQALAQHRPRGRVGVVEPQRTAEVIEGFGVRHASGGASARLQLVADSPLGAERGPQLGDGRRVAAFRQQQVARLLQLGGAAQGGRGGRSRRCA